MDQATRKTKGYGDIFSDHDELAKATRIENSHGYLTRIDQFPTDHVIGGVHCIPVTESGEIIMGWCEERALLETIGGRLDPGETWDEALAREVHEEAGLVVDGPHEPVAAFLWTDVNRYTVWVTAKVRSIGPIPDEFETTGRIITNIHTAQQMLHNIRGHRWREVRLHVLAWAEEKLKEMQLLK